MKSILTKKNNIFTTYLSYLGIRYTDQYADKLFNEHPHKYNLLGLSKMLSEYKIENQGIRISDKEESIHDLETPFIAHIGSDFVVVYKINKETVSYIWQRKNITVSIEVFCKIWTGVILYAEPDEKSIESGFKNNYRKEKFKQFQILALLFSTVLLLALVFVKNEMYNHIEYLLLGVINITGIYIVYLLVLKQMHIQSEYADKICSLFKQSDCNDILDSEAAKLGGVIGWSEIGLGYFITNIFIITCLPMYLPYLAVVNIISLPYSFWSIWYQKFKAKQWCPLCLIVQLLLWLVFLVSLIFGVINISRLNIIDGLFVGLLYLLPMLFINMLIPSLGKNKNEERAIQELNSLKADEDILSIFLRKQPKYIVDKNSSKILFGNTDANILVTILTNPHCEPCARMHARLEKILSENKNICVQYIMSYFGSMNLEISNKFLIAVYLNNGEKERMAVYNTWFKKGKYEKDDFIKGYNLDLDDDEVLKEFEKHNIWKEHSGLSATPTILINSHILPNNYKIEDLKYITNLDVGAK